MATIRAIEAKSVHQIQSGQVIVDLCSVVKELVENSLDAGATVLEVRFKNHGLDSIEVQDNGSGIAPANYESIALKHFTSKLSSYDDLSSLRTFGFRGEALSSLCALSKFSIVTAQAGEAPKGKRLDFDILGKLKSTTVVAAQKGSIATVENIFDSLPVRRKELSKNIKREYGKVLGLLNAYACIGVHVKYTMKNAMPKSKSMVVFSTKGNATTRENISNVYGAKTLGALIPVDLTLNFQPITMQLARTEKHTNIEVKGHISRPVFGEGRQTPDRQMFFVNGRPCGLPQIAKAINEVYKAFNVSQSPFVFVDLVMDTNAYDVNVSPDKRTILIHDSASLIENLKSSLNEMFDQQEQTIPQSQISIARLPAFRKPAMQHEVSADSAGTPSRRSSLSDARSLQSDGQDRDEDESGQSGRKSSGFWNHFQNITSTREEPELSEKRQERLQKAQEKRADKIAQKVADQDALRKEVDEFDDVQELVAQRQLQEEGTDAEDEAESSAADSAGSGADSPPEHHVPPAASMLSSGVEANTEATRQAATAQYKGVVINAFERMRSKKVPAERATITVGNQIFTAMVGTQPSTSERINASVRHERASGAIRKNARDWTALQFSQKLRQFGADTSEPSIVTSNGQSLGPEITLDDEETHISAQGHDNDDIDDKESTDISEDEADHSVSRESNNVSEYSDDEEKKRAEDARVAELIQAAEASSALQSKQNSQRASKALAGGKPRESTANLLSSIEFSPAKIIDQLHHMREQSHGHETNPILQATQGDQASIQDPEVRLSLTVSKPDFARMQVIGQFNLGFILAVRPESGSDQDAARPRRDELFIIDQHASDEKYNFERLQAETIVGNQRLVQPLSLDLTAVEEEIVLEHANALQKNGFVVEIDMSGNSMVGKRCRLVSLPLSKEVTLGLRDLEELIQLLNESPGSSESEVPRPTKVRKMFAMRACRSSIMIGKTLSRRQMERVVTHMGTIDKPWNCPHGRPTMRHLCTLDSIQTWYDGDVDTEVSLGEALHQYVQGE